MYLNNYIIVFLIVLYNVTSRLSTISLHSTCLLCLITVKGSGVLHATQTLTSPLYVRKPMTVITGDERNLAELALIFAELLFFVGVDFPLIYFSLFGYNRSAALSGLLGSGRCTLLWVLFLKDILYLCFFL